MPKYDNELFGPLSRTQLNILESHIAITFDAINICSSEMNYSDCMKGFYTVIHFILDRHKRQNFLLIFSPDSLPLQQPVSGQHKPVIDFLCA